MKRQPLTRLFRLTAAFLSIAALSLTSFLGIGASWAQGGAVSGTYAYDVLNKIEFLPDGSFKEQYITEKYRPDFALTDQNGRKAPAVEKETLCSASGFYTIVSSGILLDYQEDLCELKKGKKVVRYRPLARTLIINGKAYKRKSLAPNRSGRQRGFAADAVESFALEAAEVDIEAGYKTWRWQIGRAMRDLNNNSGGIWYCSSGSPRLNSTYWVWNSSVGDGGWVPNANISPSAAVEWFYRDMSSSWCTECLMAARSTYYKGLLETVGNTAFDDRFRNNRTHVVISNRSYAPTPVAISRVTGSEAEISRGDHVYFRNWTDTASCPEIGAWQGENAVAQNSSGTRTYIGLGVPGRYGAPLSSAGVLTRLWNIFARTGCPQTRTGRLNNYAITGSPLYFKNFSSSFVGSLQSGVTVTIPPGARGSMTHYKLIVPAGATSFEIMTSGGTGDCDVYLMREQWATRTLYNARSASYTNTESLIVTANAPGTWYVAVRGYGAYSGVSIFAKVN